MKSPLSRYLKIHVALPQQHGAWVMWAGPLVFGILVARAITPALAWLVLASLGAFLALQPLTLLVKVWAGRRPRDEAGPALLWLSLYGALTLAGALGLIQQGHVWTLLLGVLAAPVLVWQMWLVRRREERGQMGVELVGAGVLALNALAGCGVASGVGVDLRGLVLFALSWLQSATGIVYIYLCLEYRRMKAVPPRDERMRLAGRALLYAGADVVIVLLLAALGVAPLGAVVGYVFMAGEVVYGGVWKPPVGARPAAIGVRQTVVTVIFFVLLLIAYLY